jgi:hypothetical protein
MNILIRRVLTKPDSPLPLLATTKRTRSEANARSAGFAKREREALAQFNTHNREFYGNNGAPR